MIPDWKKVSSAVNTDSTIGPVTLGLRKTKMKGFKSVDVSIVSTSTINIPYLSYTYGII